MGQLKGQFLTQGVFVFNDSDMNGFLHGKPGSGRKKDANISKVIRDNPMFLPDPKTLSLAIGLANLLFAILASLYIATTPRANHPALAIWRWGRLLAGTGFIVNLLAGVSTWGIPAVVGNLLQATGAGFDLAAYCLL